MKARFKGVKARRAVLIEISADKPCRATHLEITNKVAKCHLLIPPAKSQDQLDYKLIIARGDHLDLLCHCDIHLEFDSEHSATIAKNRPLATLA